MEGSCQRTEYAVKRTADKGWLSSLEAVRRRGRGERAELTYPARRNTAVSRNVARDMPSGFCEHGNEPWGPIKGQRILK
jgi:hypothetical protein